ncbi:glycosyltransferase family 39 protein [Arthrobacter sp. Br18]|uniref:glycosyltransferase family 39 protein n=1 Tax=Arthrobacter sp. Br18 TaxID=1312954 RepID=UPI000479BC37|nr:glycosyltransferase family 39 protein [Arthrobacter sp. Br18]
MKRTTRPAVLAAVIALIYSGIGISVPSFWVDEAATISAVDRSLADMMRMTQSIDAVHAFYYLLINAWTAVFGLSETSLRVPSLLAVSAAAGFLVAIGRRLAGTTYGLTAALVFVVLPRTQYVATDARSYALALLSTVIATYFLVRIREGPSQRLWVGYAAAATVATLLSFYTVLAFVAHLATMLLDPALRSRWRAMLAVSPAWLIPTTALAVIGATQQFQISWIRPIDGSVAFEVAFFQFFTDAYMLVDGNPVPEHTPLESVSMYGLAVLIWALAIAGAVLFRRHFLVRLALPLLVVPLGAVIGGSLILGSPYYLPRYLSFILPSLPLLAAALVLRMPRGRAPTTTRQRAVVLLATILLALPSYAGQRTEFGRSPQDDFSFIARTLDEHAQPGEAVALGVNADLAYTAYPDSFDGLADATVGISAAEWGRIYNQRLGLEASRDQILSHATVWLVRPAEDGADEETLASFGYAPETRFEGTGSTVVKFVRQQ